jgi:4-amino-4-deoxy-L-arabinose transferase-like glycosyltransferase
VSRLVLGDSLVALRFLPAIAGGVTVYLAGLMARELGGGRFAQGLAASAAFAAPILLAMNSIYSMNSFDFIVWSAAAYLLIRILNNAPPRMWIWLGIVLGLGLLNKTSVLWLGFGIAAGLVLTKSRSQLKTPWPWIAGAIAVAGFLPYLLWNAANDFAHLEFIRNATSGKYSSLTPVRFIQDMILQENPASLPLWLGGLWFFLRPQGKVFRFLGVMYAAVLAILLVNQHSKAEYLAPAFPLLFAGGAVWAEGLRWLSSRVARSAVFAIIGLSGVMLAPLAAPALPVEAYIRYADALGMKPHTAENKQLAELPQFYADMFGWEELTATVLTVFKNLSPEEQHACIIYGQNYGEAGAVSFLGREFGLPAAVSGHNSYYHWGPAGFRRSRHYHGRAGRGSPARI